MRYSLVTFRTDGDPQLGALLADGTIVAPPELKQWSGMLELLEEWPADGLLELSLEDAPAVTGATLLAPIRFPRKVLCAGVNYRRHIREMGGEDPDSSWRPYFFMKPPTTTVIGPADPIVLHDADAARYDWEAELAIVIGVGGRDIDLGSARSHIAGYTVSNDVTARGYHKRTGVPIEAFAYDWFGAKAIDDSLPMGPGITPAALVPDPQDLRLRLWVNGELQQDESTGDMICGIDELVAAASRIVTLEPGDVICTGTPSGVGVGRGLHLKPGDVVRVAVDGLGEIENRVISEEDQP
ncbi:fumarylacetoacetate hydrolase family protein [Actinoplanes sp. NPDC051633]|uniref:fumarylacetoacetate hydrolase family protein n=1 Tax=Actinoplanes sp. NPDC051633 TaxID=3155670 RepID=UPI003424A646